MVNSQEVLTEYKKLLLNQNSIVQTQWGTIELQGNRINNSTNLITKSTDVRRRDKKLPIISSIPKLNILLQTKNNPVYTFNNINSTSQIKEENNVFLSNTNTFEILYNTEENSFIKSTFETNLENATNIEASISSTEGITAINYNYSEISLLLRFDESGTLTGRKSFLRSFRLYSYTEFPILDDDYTLLTDQIFNKPNNNPNRQAVVNSYKSSIGLTEEEAQTYYDYIQNVLNILKLYPEVKIRNSTQLSTSTNFLIKNSETDANIIIPEPPSFIFGKSLGTNLGNCSTKYSEDFISFNFRIGRERQYQLGREFNEAFVLKTIDFSTNTLQPFPPVSPLPYQPNNTGLKINLSPLEFSLVILNEDFQVIQNEEIPSSLTVNVEGKLFYKLNKFSNIYEELKSFSFSFSDGELQGDFIFGNEFIFDSPYLAYYLVIDSFEVQI